MAQQKTAIKSGNGRTSTKSLKKSGAHHAKSSDTKRGSTPAVLGDEELKIDRRRSKRRNDEGKAIETQPAPKPTLERRQKVNRRRQIDPTTCERDYTDQEVEFMNALDDYKRKSGRMFPTCSEVLEVINSLGYVKLSPATSGSPASACSASSSAKPMPSDWPIAGAEASTDGGDLTNNSIEEHLAY